MKNYSPNNLYFIIPLILFLFVYVSSASALELKYPHIPGVGEANDTINTLFEAGKIGIAQIVQIVFATALGMAGLLAFGVLLYVGFMYATTGANPLKRLFAKQRLQGLVAGVLILLGIYIIVGMINPDLLSLGNRTFSICGTGEQTCAISFPQLRDEPVPGAIGPATPCSGKRTTPFQQAYGASVEDVAEFICVTNGKLIPAESKINSILISMVGADTCTPQDVQDIKTALPNTPSCAGQTPAGGVSGDITIDEQTLPHAFCEYNTQAHAISGPVFNGGWKDTQALIVPMFNFVVTDQVIDLIRDNINAIAQDCATPDYSNYPQCYLKDSAPTPLTSLNDEQKELLVEVCTNVIRGAANATQ